MRTTAFQLVFVTSDLKLGTNAQGGASSLGLSNTFNDPITVAFPIQGPLI